LKVANGSKRGDTMATQLEEKARWSGETAKVIGPDYEGGAPDQPHRWRSKLRGRAEILKYLQSAERYWYSKEWYGSEKRKTPA
jgi:hypothetical protein